MNFGLRFAENGAPRATRRIGTMVNVADDRNDHRAPRGDRNEFQSTRCREQAPRATRRIGTMVNVADDCNDHRAPRGDRHEFRSTLRAATDMNFGLRFAENGAPRATRRIGTMVNVADDRNDHRAPRGDRHEFRSNPPRGDRHEFRSTLCRKRGASCDAADRHNGQCSGRPQRTSRPTR